MAATTTFVVDEADVEPIRAERDTASIRVTFDASNGCERLEQRVVRFAPGRSQEKTLDGHQEVLFVVAGRGQLEVDGGRHPPEPGTAGVLSSRGTVTNRETWAG